MIDKHMQHSVSECFELFFWTTDRLWAQLHNNRRLIKVLRKRLHLTAPIFQGSINLVSGKTVYDICFLNEICSSALQILQTITSVRINSKRGDNGGGYVGVATFQTSCYCRAKLARLQHDTSTTWFQTSNLIRANRMAVAKNKTQK